MNMGHFAGLQSAGPLDRRDGRGNLRDLPPRVRNSNHTFSIRDRGVAQWKTDAFSYTWTIPDERIVGAFPEGFSVPLFNHASSQQPTISPAAGVTLIEGPTTGAFVLTPGNSRMLSKVPGLLNTWRLW